TGCSCAARSRRRGAASSSVYEDGAEPTRDAPLAGARLRGLAAVRRGRPPQRTPRRVARTTHVWRDGPGLSGRGTDPTDRQGMARREFAANPEKRVEPAPQTVTLKERADDVIPATRRHRAVRRAG